MLRTKEVTIDAEKGGRDAGKTYLLTEMPAIQADKWAMRFLNALLASGISIPDDAVGAGLAGLASVASKMGEAFGTFRGLNMDAIEPLLDQLLDCVQFKASGGSLRKLMHSAGDIQEVKTIWTLRRELLELHLGFSLADKFRELSASTKAKTPQAASPTSRGRSRRS